MTRRLGTKETMGESSGREIEQVTDSPRGTSRRGFLKLAGGVVAGAGAGFLSAPGRSLAQDAEATAPEGEPLRLVFMPCTHLRREYDSAEGLATAIQAAQELDPPPEFIVTGGDLVHNLRDEGLEEANELSDQLVEIFEENATVPVYHGLGNHDAAGWRDGDIPEDDPQFGFNMLVEKLDMEGEDYTFDVGDWHFVMLNNVNLTEPGEYVGEFTEKQLEFLRDDLQENQERPTMIFGHMPPVSAIEFFDGEAELEDEEWTLEADRVTINPADLVRAMDCGDVRAFLSGHIHRLDRVEARGHTFICSGSVSGDQWQGEDVDTPEGFGVVDLYPDGTFDYDYYDYGWEPPQEAIEDAEEEEQEEES